MAVMAVWAAVLITYGVSMDSTEPGVLPLDMAPNSVDDMYDGCKGEMMSKVTEYLEQEKNQDSNFKTAWGKAETHNKHNSSTTLGKEQAMAIYAYTFKETNLYFDFNTAVRTQKSEYNTTFKYHTLHFFLTDALQTLIAHEHKAERCLTGFRAVNRSFSQDVLNKAIRFSSFTSSSMTGYLTKTFGDKSCFEIVTCFGAYIAPYSAFESEEEVLIPPYEVFNVTKIETRSNQNNLPCEVVYKMKSTGKKSNLNCTLITE